MALGHLLPALSLWIAGTSLSLAATPVIREVIWATPMDWDRYVDHEGKGLYVDIVQKVFSDAGIAVKRIEMPWKRALRDVKAGRADFTGGLDPSPSYSQSQFPIDQSGEYVFYLRQTFGKGDIREWVRQHRGVWALGYVDAFPGPIRKLLKGSDIADRDQALRMVLAGRADYYLDNAFQMETTLQHIVFPHADYQCRELFHAKVYMSFTANPRGKTLRAFWDKRIETLYHSGALQKIYETWRFRFPELAIARPDRSPKENADYLSCLEFNRIATDKK